MSLQYNQVNISINGYYILTETININESSPQKPIYVFNNSIPFDNIPTTLKNSIDISYFLEPTNDNSYSTLLKLINDTTTIQPSLINIGNVYITGYLNNYSFKLDPSNLIKVSTSYEVYSPLTGQLTRQNIGDYNLYDTRNSSGIANYWAANFYSGANLVTNNNILQLDYTASIALTPVYSLGNYQPAQVYINHIEEKLNILSEVQINTQFTGQLICSFLPSLQNLVINNISTVWTTTPYDSYITIPITGFILNEVKSDINTDNIVMYSMSFARYH